MKVKAGDWKDRATKAETIIREIWDALYGQNLTVYGWHQNGDEEPLDNWFEENDWLIELEGEL